MALPPPPRLKPAQPPNPPLLPEKWKAAALVTPFPDDSVPAAPFVADVAYDWSVQAMQLNCYSLDGGSLTIMAVGAGTYYERIGGKWFGPYSNPDWSVPSPTWLASRNLSCQGVGKLMGVDCQWWVGISPCQNGYEDPNAPPSCQGGTWCADNWIWARADNGYPTRLMSISQGNPYQLPILGDNALVHLPTFAPVQQTELPQNLADASASGDPATESGSKRHGARLASVWPRAQGAPAPSTNVTASLRASALKATEEEKSAALAAIEALIPGLKPLPGNCTPFGLPVWPEKLYMTALTTPTFPYQVPQHPTPTTPWYNAQFPTQVYYDASQAASLKQLSRFYQPDGTILDNLLLVPQSYVVWRDGNGNVTSCIELTPNVGPPVRDWPASDGSTCLAMIVDNPHLSPGRTTLIIGCPSNVGRCFYIWYTTEGQAVLFTEVPQCCDVNLTLIDYYDFAPNPQLPAGIFDIPPQCGGV